MTLSCAIVDDEPLALDLLESYVRRTPFLELKAKCASATEALTAASEQSIDLFFLDIQMPQLNGIELSRLLGERTKVIFTTAFDQYAVEGFRVEALDYLLKPISYTEFVRSASRALKWFETTQPQPTQQKGTEEGILYVKSDYKLIRVRIDQICYIEGVKDYIKIVREEGAPLLTLMSMKAIEEALPAEKFIRVHRSYIVNREKIEVIDRNRIVFGKTYIPVSDSYKERFAALLEKHLLQS